METHLNSTVRLLHTAAEAMHHPAEGSEIQVAQQAEELVIRLAHMQTHRQSQVPRPKHLPLQHLALLLVVGLVPIQIKSYLPYSYALGKRAHLF